MNRLTRKRLDAPQKPVSQEPVSQEPVSQEISYVFVRPVVDRHKAVFRNKKTTRGNEITGKLMKVDTKDWNNRTDLRFFLDCEGEKLVVTVTKNRWGAGSKDWKPSIWKLLCQVSAQDLSQPITLSAFTASWEKGEYAQLEVLGGEEVEKFSIDQVKENFRSQGVGCYL